MISVWSPLEQGFPLLGGSGNTAGIWHAWSISLATLLLDAGGEGGRGVFGGGGEAGFSSVLQFLSLVSLPACFELSQSLLLVAYHQSEMSPPCFYFANSLQPYDCSNSDYNWEGSGQLWLWCIIAVSFSD